MQMLRTLPHFGLIPLFITWFGIGETPKLALIAMGVAFPLYLNTFGGIRNIDTKITEAAAAMGLTWSQRIRHVVIPGALPQMLVGLRQSLGIAWLSLIVAETISASSGLGYMINLAKEFQQTDVIVVGLAVYSLLGLATDSLVRIAERKSPHMAFLKHPSPSTPTRPADQADRVDQDSPVARVRDHSRSFGDTHVLKSIDLDIRRASSSSCSAAAAAASRPSCAAWPASTPSPADEVRVAGRSSVAFQEPRLLPWKRVRDNVALALLNTPDRQAGTPSPSRRSRRSASATSSPAGRASSRAARRSGCRWPVPS